MPRFRQLLPPYIYWRSKHFEMFFVFFTFEVLSISVESINLSRAYRSELLEQNKCGIEVYCPKNFLDISVLDTFHYYLYTYTVAIVC